MDELPRHARDIVRLARDEHDCFDEQARARVRERIAHTVGGEAGALGEVQLATGAGKGALFVGGAKLTLVAGLVATIVVGAALRMRQDGEPSTAAHEKPSASRAAPALHVPPSTAHLQRAEGDAPAHALSSAARAASPSAHEPPTMARAPAREKPSSAHDRGVDTLDAEVALLRRVAAAVAAADVPRASRLLAQHRRRFAQPALKEERAGFEALVHCLAGRRDAHELGRTFLAEHPRSVLAPRVGEACARAEEER